MVEEYVWSSDLWRDDLAGGGIGTTTEKGHLQVSIGWERKDCDERGWIAGVYRENWRWMS